MRKILSVVACCFLAAAGKLSGETINFGSLAQGGVDVFEVASPYSTQGYVFADSDGPFFVWQTDSFAYAGAVALSPSSDTAMVSLTRSGGGTFNLSAISFAPAAPFFTASQDVTVLGKRPDGTTASQKITLNGSFQFSPLMLDSTFRGLSEVTIQQAAGGGGVQFTNVVVNADSLNQVPEPSSVLLVSPVVVASIWKRRQRQKAGGANERKDENHHH